MRADHQAGLPGGSLPRPATVDDAEIIHAVQSAHEIPLIGRPNSTLEDVRDELVEPDFAVGVDGFLIFPAADPTTAVGWGWACRKGASDIIDVSIAVHPEHGAVRSWLLDAALRRAVEIGRELGHPRIRVFAGVHRADEPTADLLRTDGFEHSTTFSRMRIDHQGPVPTPVPPEGIELRDGSDPQVRRDAVDVRNAAFADHFGFVPQTVERWSADREASSAHDWAMLHVAYDGGEPVALLLRTNNFVPDENCGYVLTLGVAPKHQGRGLGGYLLRHAFALDIPRA
jgi:mycothiol synthase